jgi:hypothetical protein
MKEIYVISIVIISDDYKPIPPVIVSNSDTYTSEKECYDFFLDILKDEYEYSNVLLDLKDEDNDSEEICWKIIERVNDNTEFIEKSIFYDVKKYSIGT